MLLDAQSSLQAKLAAIGAAFQTRDLRRTICLIEDSGLLATSPDLNNVGGICQLLSAQPDAGLARFEQAVALRPDFADAWSNRGRALLELGRHEEAVASYDIALGHRPMHAETLLCKGMALRRLGRPDDARICIEAAIAQNPGCAEAWNNRGNALRDLDRFDEALASFDRAVSLEPRSAEAWNNRGVALKEMGRLSEALASHETALAQDGNFYEARFNRGIVHLLRGDFDLGWPDYEARWLQARLKTRLVRGPWPIWRGDPLAGRSLIVFSEQGFGDIIQFVRYLPPLAAGRRLTFVVDVRMHRLLRSVFETIDLRASFDPGASFDLQTCLMSLPLLSKTTLASVPAEIPYLAAEANLCLMWRARIGGRGFRIGIGWQGDPRGAVDRGRSIPLAAFAPLAGLPGVRLISLQKHDGIDQLSSLPPGMAVETLGAECDSGADAFIDTAAVMAELDLVVTSDTALAHLAGALGRPVWVALQTVPDWRWLAAGEASPWYPTMRLFRQTRRGDWGEVFARIAAAVSGLIAAAPSNVL